MNSSMESVLLDEIEPGDVLVLTFIDARWALVLAAWRCEPRRAGRWWNRMFLLQFSNGSLQTYALGRHNVLARMRAELS